MKMTIAIAAIAMSFAAIANAKGTTDQDFVTKAAEGGLAEVELGKIATARASATDVKKFGQQMVDDHGKANDELKAAASKAGATVPTEPSASQKAMVKDHHEDIDLFKKEAESGKNPDLKAFAEKTLPTLQSHLKMAEALNAAK